jgi:Uma2 family endonuclease
MGKNLKNEVEYYYDSHPTPEDLMGESSLHRDLTEYLKLVLTWLFRGQPCAIYANLNFYQTRHSKEHPLAPDIAVIKGVPFQHLRSWKVGRTGPPPHVVFEFASDKTRNIDLEEKPLKYALMGVEEYFFYDPDDSPNWKERRHKLLGWHFNKATGAIREIPADEQGRLWSQHLESFLVPDGMYLRLHDHNHQRRLTEAEALAQKLRSLGLNPDEI